MSQTEQPFDVRKHMWVKGWILNRRQADQSKSLDWVAFEDENWDAAEEAYEEFIISKGDAQCRTSSPL